MSVNGKRTGSVGTPLTIRIHQGWSVFLTRPGRRRTLWLNITRRFEGTLRCSRSFNIKGLEESLPQDTPTVKPFPPSPCNPTSPPTDDLTEGSPLIVFNTTKTNVSPVRLNPFRLDDPPLPLIEGDVKGVCRETVRSFIYTLLINLLYPNPLILE